MFENFTISTFLAVKKGSNFVYQSDGRSGEISFCKFDTFDVGREERVMKDSEKKKMRKKLYSNSFNEGEEGLAWKADQQIRI